MPERRFDPLSSRWVLLAPERAGRPGVDDLRSDGAEERSEDPAPCDFCGGREDATPPETFRLPFPGPWRVRVVPNMYPATPFHEVVIHSPEHEALLETLAPDHRADVGRAWQERLRTSESVCALAVLNRGRLAGASRYHDHSQLFGLEVVPPTIEREVGALAAESCPACELGADESMLVAGGPVRLVAHPAPLVPHELLVLPEHDPRFESAPDSVRDAFMEALADAVLRLRRAGLHAFNVVVHSAPRAAGRFHWHAHVYPRTTVWAGLELGAGIPIVAADPSTTASLLRSA